MKTVVDLDKWERKFNFEYFKTFVNPFITLVVRMDCTETITQSKIDGSSVFLRYVHAILKAVNETEQLKYRIDRADRVVRFQRIDVLAPVLKADNEYHIVRLFYRESFEEFNQLAREATEGLSDKSGDPFEHEKKDVDGDNLDVVMISALPWIDFTGFVPAQENKNGSSFPLISVGKITEADGRFTMPFSLSAHHGFIDGYHISLFFDRVQSNLSNFN